MRNFKKSLKAGNTTPFSYGCSRFDGKVVKTIPLLMASAPVDVRSSTSHPHRDKTMDSLCFHPCDKPQSPLNGVLLPNPKLHPRCTYTIYNSPFGI